MATVLSAGKRVLAALLCFSVTAQPLLAEPLYRIPLKWSQDSTGPGNGEGNIEIPPDPTDPNQPGGGGNEGPGTPGNPGGGAEGGAVAFFPNALNFGELEAGASASGTATLRHVGKEPVALTDWATSPALHLTHTCGDTLSPGDTCQVNVLLPSADEGAASETVSVATSEGVSTLVVTSSTPRAVDGPVLELSKSSIGFGKVPVRGAPKSEEVLVRSVGTAPVSLSRITVSPEASAFGAQHDCPASLAPGASCKLQASFAPGTVGTATAAVELDTATKKYRLGLSGIGGGAVAAVTSLDFGPRRLDSPSSRSITLANRGNMPLEGISVSSSGSAFAVNASPCGSTLPANSSCAIAVTYSPVQGVSAGELLVSSSNAERATGSLRGEGVDALVVASEQAVDFGALAVGSSSPPATVTLTNVGSSAASLTQISSDSAAFRATSRCPDTLEPGSGCEVDVVALPRTADTHAGELRVAVANAPATVVSLRAEGLGATLDWSGQSAIFGALPVGDSLRREFLLTNSGNATARGLAVALDGSPAFALASNACPAALAAGQSCAVAVTFAPTATASAASVLTATASDGVSRSRPLMGSGGAALALSPESLNFGGVNVGEKSEVRAVAVANLSSASLGITGISVLYGESSFAQSNDCGDALPALGTCTVNVQATAANVGPATGSVAVQADTETAALHLSVNGTRPLLEVSPPTDDSGPGLPDGDGFLHYTIRFPNTQLGVTSDPKTATLRNVGDGPLRVASISLVDGADSFGMTHACPETLAPGEACVLSFTFSPAISGSQTGAVAVETSNGRFYFDLVGKGSAVDLRWVAGSKDFTQVTVGATRSLTLGFGNEGLLLARDVNVSVSDPTLSVTKNNCSPTISPEYRSDANRRCYMTLAWSPLAVGALAGAVVRLEPSNGPALELPLSGNAVAPDLRISGSLDFGLGNPVGATYSKTVTIRNHSASELPYSNLSVTGTAMSTGGATTCASSGTLRSGATCSVEVVYAPTQEGTSAPRVRLESMGVPFEKLGSAGALVSEVTFSGSLASQTPPSLSIERGNPNGLGAASTVVEFPRVYANSTTDTARTYTLAVDGTGYSLGTYGRCSAANSCQTYSASGTPTSITVATSADRPHLFFHLKASTSEPGPVQLPATVTLTALDTSISVAANVTLDNQVSIVAMRAGASSSLQAASVLESSELFAFPTVPYNGAPNATNGSASSYFFAEVAGAYGAVAGRWVIEGDKDFTLSGAGTVNSSTGYGACPTAISAWESSRCIGMDVSAVNGRPSFRVAVNFAPLNTGARSAVLLFVPDESSGLPAQRVSLTGFAVNDTFIERISDAAGAAGYSGYPVSTTRANGEQSDLGVIGLPLSNSASLLRTFYVKTGGTVGQVAGVWSIEGDDGFTFNAQGLVFNDSANALAYCYPNVNTRQSGICLGEDAGRLNTKRNFSITVKFVPSAEGHRTGTLKFTPFSPEMGPVQVFNLVAEARNDLEVERRTVATGSWPGVMGVEAKVLGPDGLDERVLSDNRPVGGTVTTTNYVDFFAALKLKGTAGRMPGVWSLTGSPEFTLQAAAVVNDGGNLVRSCTGRAQTAGVSDECAAEDISTGIYRHPAAQVRYRPTAETGTARATMTFTPAASVGRAPYSIELVVNLAYNVTYVNPRASDTAISYNASSDFQPGSTMDFGQANGSTLRYAFVAFEGTNGLPTGRWSLNGDAAFTLTHVGTAQKGSNATSSCSGFAAGGQSQLADCRSADLMNGNNEAQRAQVRFYPTAAGSYSSTLTYTPHPGSGEPPMSWNLVGRR